MLVTAALKIYGRRVCAMIAALALVFVVLGAPGARAEADGMVRVRLTRLGAPTAIVMTADCDYYLASDPSVRVKAGTQIRVTADGDQLTLQAGSARVELGQSARLMRSEAGNRGVRFTQPELSNRFCGDLGFSASGGVINTVLNIYIENYLYGVVGYEMSPSSNIEALKAQAVAARTYALRKKASRAEAAYDLTDTTSDQVFKGYSGQSEYENVVRAVDMTRGGVLYYGDALAMCYYSASNGGQTESSRNAWGSALAYTQVKDDPYDYESGATVKTAVIRKDASDMHPSLKSALVEGMRDQLADNKLSTAPSDIRVNYVEAIVPGEARFVAPSRVYKSLVFRLNVTGMTADGTPRTGTVAVSIPTFGGLEKWYELSINSEDNETVWVKETDAAFEVSFRRFGHGVGMSQRGAQDMAANHGMRMVDILSFYYPGTTGRQLNLADTTRDKRAVESQPAQTVIATARLVEKTNLLDSANGSGTPTATVAAGATVDVYAVQGDWAAVGSSGKYGFVPTDSLATFSLTGAEVTRPDSPAYGDVHRDVPLLQLPVAQAKALSTIPAGRQVQVYAWTDTWAMAESPEGLVGFVPVDALDLVNPALYSDEDEADDEESDAVVAAPDDLYGQLRRDATLYTAADRFSDPLETLYQGSVVLVIAYNSEWARVRTQGNVEGFLALDCIAALDSTQMAGGAQDTAPEIDGGPVTRVNGAQYLYVKSAEAGLYADWAEGAQVLAVLAEGARVRVGAYNSAWACVKAPDGTQGYMRVQDLTADAPQSNAGDDVVYEECEAVAREALDVYPSAKAASVVGQIPSGAVVRVRAWNGAFAYVEYNGLGGFVRLKYLDRLP